MIKKIFENSPLRIALFYLVFSLIYIYYSDRLLLRLVNNSETITQLQTYKGFAFVIVSALLIFMLSRYEMRRKIKMEQHITRKEKEYDANLQKSYNELEKKVEERTTELINKNNDLKTFTYTVSHDLRTPLRSITAFSQLLINHHLEKLDEEGKEFLNYIVQSAKQMNKLIEDLVKYSRLDFFKAEFREISLNEVLNEVKKTLENKIKESSAEIIIPENLPAVKADSTLLLQIFLNLIDNAILYRKNDIKPIIKIEYENDHDDNIVLFVKDNGIGIDSQFSEKIFNVFQRLHNNDTYQGTGIGLAIVKKNAAILNGAAWLEKSTLGEGSTFCVQLPLSS